MQKFKGQYIKDKKGQNTVAGLPIGEYDELLEDIHDLSVVAKRRGELTITFKEINQRLRKDGLL